MYKSVYANVKCVVKIAIEAASTAAAQVVGNPPLQSFIVRRINSAYRVRFGFLINTKKGAFGLGLTTSKVRDGCIVRLGCVWDIGLGQISHKGCVWLCSHQKGAVGLISRAPRVRLVCKITTNVRWVQVQPSTKGASGSRRLQLEGALVGLPPSQGCCGCVSAAPQGWSVWFVLNATRFIVRVRLGEQFGTKGAFGCVKEIKGCLVGCVTATSSANRATTSM
ncbi:hypothetical protein Tco_0322411 [Tanacetum coccineum]